MRDSPPPERSSQRQRGGGGSGSGSHPPRPPTASSHRRQRRRPPSAPRSPPPPDGVGGVELSAPPDLLLRSAPPPASPRGKGGVGGGAGGGGDDPLSSPPDVSALLAEMDAASAEGGGAAAPPGPILDLLGAKLAELDRAEGRIASRAGEVLTSARSLLSETGGALLRGRGRRGPSAAGAEEAARFRRAASEVAASCLDLGGTAREWAGAFRSVARRADARLGTRCSEDIERTLSRPPWSSAVTGGEVIATLGDVYSNVRALEGRGDGGGGGGGGGGWVAPSSFERKTHKFWIKEGRMMEVMMAAVAEVPVLVYGQGGSLAHKGDGRGGGSPDGGGAERCLATPVNSVYFDNDSFHLYRERLARKEGSRLLRARWYGDVVPRGGDTLFLELKTHHESWVDAKSVKQRVAICECDMAQLLRLFGVAWTRSSAKVVVRRADPSLAEEDLAESIELLLECRRMIVQHRLRPRVGTRYLRAAFQSPKSNALRLTVDRSIVLTDESGAPPGGWRIPDDEGAAHRRRAIEVPCAVLEVKVNGEEVPPLVRELRDFGAISDGHRFSKCLTAVAAFRADEVRELPYWAELPLFQSIFDFGDDNNDDDDDDDGRADQVSVASGGKGAERARAVVRKRGSDVGTEYSEEDVEVFSNEGMPNGAGRGAPRGFGALFGMRMRRDKQKPISYARPVKVEPKSYFANERTFIQWISAALLMVTVAAILVEFGQDTAVTTSLVLFILAMVVVAYALAVYYRRIYLMQRRRTHGYVDLVGPAFLALAVLLGMGSILYYHSRSVGPNVLRPARRVRSLSVEPGVCDRLGLGGTSPLDYQPSDALADMARGLLLVPSVNVITALSLDPAVVTDVRVIGGVPGGDIEALTYVGDTVYAVSEHAKKSELFAFRWDENNDALYETLAVAGRWQIDAPGVESITYIPGGSSSYAGKLIIGSERGLEVYSVPFPGNGDTSRVGPLLYPVRSINRRLICHGLQGDCKVGSMQFFDGLLYVLHDNDRVIRSWDMFLGRRVAEYSLPWVDGGFDKQWEGMSLVRTEPGDGGKSSLRKRTSPVSSLRLYLTLDTPPQVWSIALGEGETGWDVPDCAAGSFVKQ